MSQPFQYDVFLGHNSRDKPAVRELAERLQADGLSVWLDEWQIEPDNQPRCSILHLTKSNTSPLAANGLAPLEATIES